MNAAKHKLVKELQNAIKTAVDGFFEDDGDTGAGAAVAEGARVGAEAPRAATSVPRPTLLPEGSVPGAGLSVEEFDWLYNAIKERIIADAQIDPVLIHLATSRPELVVQFEPRVVKLNRTDGVRGRVAGLIADGFFDESKAPHAVRQELKRLGNDPGGGGTLYDVLKNFARDGFLVVESDRYSVAPGLKVTKEELQAV